ncbi:MAG: hypothetical protein M1433_01785 [Candidatus Parvarchaeota archaeon]|nr:hypothetical protein [Candidatus Parvarchaeota archaeon]
MTKRKKKGKKSNFLVYLVSLGLFALLTFFYVMFYLIGNLATVLYNNFNIFSSLIASSFFIAGFCIAMSSFLLNHFDKKLKIDIKNYLKYALFFIIGGFLMFSNLIAGEYAQVSHGKVNFDIYFTLLVIGMFGLAMFTFGIWSLIYSLWTTYKRI